MLTIDALKEYGADVDEGLGRCMGMEDFYLRMVGLQLQDKNFDKLENALDAGDVRGAFEAAHALKGALANLALKPLIDPVSVITERFRNAAEPADVSDVMPAYREALDELRKLAE